ncbi:hypothetical protein SASPL_125454 [Salvia splendens]|uniref:ACB domain-containing protein n=1 Tax=Salvia splendens TaxID=180675 RepID=A0A8X8ZPV5_SALSN|nr:hypothetical protein SASPL_125454 [Salvia splendens]
MLFFNMKPEVTKLQWYMAFYFMFLLVFSNSLTFGIEDIVADSIEIFSYVFLCARQAWKKLGAMPPEEAMEKYIDVVSELYPTWASCLASHKKRDESNSDTSMGGAGGGPMGPVFSTFAYEEESGSDLWSSLSKLVLAADKPPGIRWSLRKLDDFHAFAREGDEVNLLKCIEIDAPLNLKDSEGRTPLHWAVDRGHLNITALLLNKNADVNAKDGEGLTPLHYAAGCERTAIAELLVKHGADIEVRDNEGNAPRDLCGSRWSGLELVTKAAG